MQTLYNNVLRAAESTHQWMVFEEDLLLVMPATPDWVVFEALCRKVLLILAIQVDAAAFSPPLPPELTDGWLCFGSTSALFAATFVCFVVHICRYLCACAQSMSTYVSSLQTLYLLIRLSYT